MNPCKKLYCRIFQNAFRIAIPFLPYRKPKIVGSIKSLPEIIRKKKCDTVLIITDEGIRKLGLTLRLEKTLTKNNIPYFIYDQTVANPTTANVAEAVEIYQTNQCNAIIGFGGGSSIDCAKAVGARIAKPHQSLAQMKGILKIHKKLPLLIAIPTTAGTGSETTLAAVYRDGQNIDARRNMLKASFYAGCAFTKSYVGYVHAVAHSLGGEYNVPHGLANAILLPFVLEAYGDTIYKKLHRLSIAAGIADKDMPHEEAAKGFIRAIKDMKRRFQIGDTVPAIREEDIPKLAHYADKEANPLYPVPVLMNAKELEVFYYQLMPDAQHGPDM